MSPDRSARSRASKKASRELKNRRRSRAGRALLMEPLEKRLAMAVALPGHDHADDLNPVSNSAPYLPTHYHQVQAAQGQFLSGPASGTPAEVAVTYLRTHAADFGLTVQDLDNFAIKNMYTSASTGVTHIYLKQMYNGLEIGNADLNINVTRDGRVINVGSTFVDVPAASATPTPQIDAANAFKQFGEDLGFTFASNPTVMSLPQGTNRKTLLSPSGVAADAVHAELQYMAVPGGLELTWKLNVQTKDRRHWFDAHVAADDGTLLSVNDWVSHASYEVFPLPVDSPDDGTRTIVTDPHDPIASPFGWHDVNGQPGPDFIDTRGNNVFAQEDRNGIAFAASAPVPVARPSGGSTLDFRSTLDLTMPSSFYTDASVTNLFYLTNVAHDIFYRYGFDEASGNFQATNYTGLGRGGDAVLGLTQVGANLPVPINNAFMATPPDGFQPMMVMGEFNLDITALQAPVIGTYAPPRDSSFATSVVIHEYSHGVTNRLTGGSANSNALQAQQSGAMGEGWGDFFALWFTQRPTDPIDAAHPQGVYLAGPLPSDAEKGFRRFPYSFDMTVNPLTFGDYNAAGGANCNTATSNCEVHNAGEIWAQTLWDLNWVLIQKYGYDPDLYNGTGGNNLAMQLVMDGLKLQPANPTFTNARDAILLADLIANKGVNHKEIWTAFARRGMGFSADSDVLDLGSQPGTNPPIVFLDSPNSVAVRQAFDLPSTQGRVQGRVWNDENGNGVLDGNEQGMANVTLYVDVNANGLQDPLEPTTTSAADGSYEFEFFTPNTYRIGQIEPAGFQQTFPANNGDHIVTVVNNQTVTGINFGNRRGSPSAGGIVFLDEDGDGRRHPFEPGMANVFVFADLDNDGRLDLGEPQTRTAADGSYNLVLSHPGTYFVRQSVPPGFVQTVPANNGGYQVTVVSGTLNAQFEFGNAPAEDWGDAPSPFPTLASQNGAVHGFLPGFFLGASVDLEANGNPNATATGDDLAGLAGNDEDGVTFTSAIFPGGTATVNVTVNLKDRIIETVQGRTREIIRSENAAGRLHAWIDLNRDGDWDDPGEKVFNALLLDEGTHQISFPVPRNATPGTTYMRFRYAYEHVLGPGGRATAGEVEDYQVRILSANPDAQDDVFSVEQNSNANPLDVLANDVPSASGPLTILSTGATTNGGTVLISPDRLSLRYTPRPGFIGNDSFTYTVRDAAGVTDTARVSITVLPAFAQPIAVDDSFDVNVNSGNNELDVMANDLPGRQPPIGIVSFVAPANGIAVIDDRGTANPSDDVFRYTPNVGFGGTDVFQYTIEDAIGQQSTALVTVHVQPGDMLDDIVQLRLEITDINDQPIAAIGVGEAFKLRAYVDDLRADDGVDDGVDRRGVGAAYLDVLFPFNLVSFSDTINFAPEYRNAISGNINTPGLINEVGALQTGNEPLGADELLLFEVTGIATGVGIARFVGDPADQISENPGVSPDHDTILFEPPNTVSIRQIRYVNSSLQIVGTGGRPQATDNTYTIPANSVDFSLNVLDNDVEQDNPPLTITAVGGPTTTTFITPNGGRVVIAPDNSRLLYTPRAGFSGTEQFSYTVSNSVGLTSTAVVTVQVGAVPKDVNFRLDTTNFQGQHIDSIEEGSSFQVRVYVQDVRSNPPDPNRMGVFAAYLDLLYESDLVSTIGDVNTPFGFRMEFGPQYSNGQSASNAQPNIIDELGAFQESFAPLGSGEFLLATITFRAEQAGVADFISDPSDIVPLHDVLLFEPDETAVPLSRIGFRSASIMVTGNGEGERSPFQNPTDRMDVNADGVRSAMDALVVVNALNQTGSRSLLAGGEGENGILKFIDVNGDRQLTPIDALQVINALNARAGGEGESSLDVGPGVPELKALPIDSSELIQPTSAILTVGTSAQVVLPPAAPQSSLTRIPLLASGWAAANGHDRVFAAIASSDDSDDSDSDDLESVVVNDLLDALLGSDE